MPGYAIGKSLNLGYEGNVSRSVDAIITARKAREKIGFGKPCILNQDNTYSPFGASNTAGQFVGVAVREVKQAISYTESVNAYEANERCDVISRGTVNVKINNGTPTAGGKVYIRTVVNEDVSKGIVGEFEAVADTGKTIELTNAIFTTGKVDANGIAEITILSRNA